MARIGYVLNAFPVVSETFILNELRAVGGAGLPIAVFSLARPPAGPRHRALGELSGPCVYPPDRLHRALGAHARVAAARPGPYLRALAAALRGARPARGFAVSPRRLRKTLRRFHRSVWIGDAASRLGVVHVHAHYAREPLETAERVRRLTGTPYSFAAHAKDLFTTPGRRLAQRLRAARFAVTCHGSGREHLAALADARDAHKVMHVVHGIDARVFHPSDGPREPGLILAVGRLTAKKGFDRLVRACARLRDDGRDFRCEIIGEGRLRGELQAAIDAHALGERVRIRPFVAQEELPGRYRRAAVLAMPAVCTPDGNRDGIPNVVVEAMACGLPVVASRVGGIPEMVEDGRTGALVEPGDVRALADGLAALLDDPARAERLGRAGAAKAGKLDFRETNSPLVERLRATLRSPVERELRRVAERAWRPGGLAEQAGRALGRPPLNDPEAEAAIRARVAPGVRANAWRTDLRRLVQRRLWDELYKARSVLRVEDALGGSLPQGRVLDLGCGRGGLSVALGARGAAVVGIDLRRRNCRLARWRGRRYALDLPASVARGERLPFRDASFSLVCCLEVVEHAVDPEGLLREIRRVLVPGGACALTIVNRFAHRDPHYHLWGVNFVPRRLATRYVAWRGRAKPSSGDLQTLDEMHYYRFRAFERLARSHGFTVEDVAAPSGRLRAALHRLGRFASLGFNDALLVLRT